LGIVVADVTDKGTAAALYMALSLTLIRTYAVDYSTQPELALGAVHRRIMEDTYTKQFVTVFFGVLDPASGTLSYANAGHNPPYLFSAENNGEIHELDNTGPPVGLRMFPDMTWDQATVQLKSGDTLVLYSDGITEAQDLDEGFYEEGRLKTVAGANLRRSAVEIQDIILADVQEFIGDAPQYDDITLLVLVRE
jgi:serine phosphatase RsbU (regulator of sigma subunit)